MPDLMSKIKHSWVLSLSVVLLVRMHSVHSILPYRKQVAIVEPHTKSVDFEIEQVRLPAKQHVQQAVFFFELMLYLFGLSNLQSSLNQSIH